MNGARLALLRDCPEPAVREPQVVADKVRPARGEADMGLRQWDSTLLFQVVDESVAVAAKGHEVGGRFVLDPLVGYVVDMERCSAVPVADVASCVVRMRPEVLLAPRIPLVTVDIVLVVHLSVLA